MCTREGVRSGFPSRHLGSTFFRSESAVPGPAGKLIQTVGGAVRSFHTPIVRMGIT